MAASSATRYGNGGKGVGWGGPARGPGNGNPSFVDNPAVKFVGTPSPAVRMAVAEREALRRDQAEIVKDEMFRIATAGVREADRVNAGAAFLDRIEGKPVQRNVNLHGELSDLTDDELVEERARLAARVDPGNRDHAGAIPAESPARPADVGD